VRLEELGQLKNLMTSSGIEPACSIVPQPTTLPRKVIIILVKILYQKLFSSNDLLNIYVTHYPNLIFYIPYISQDETYSISLDF
jgi:hypothetical protein